MIDAIFYIIGLITAQHHQSKINEEEEKIIFNIILLYYIDTTIQLK